MRKNQRPLRPCDLTAQRECRAIVDELRASGHRGRGGYGPTGSGEAYIFVEGERSPISVFGYSDE